MKKRAKNRFTKKQIERAYAKLRIATEEDRERLLRLTRPVVAPEPATVFVTRLTCSTQQFDASPPTLGYYGYAQLQ